MRKGQSSVPNLLLHDWDGRTVAERSSAVDFGEETLHVERVREHRHLGAVRSARPLLLRPVAVELDAVPVGVGQVDSLARPG